MQRDRTRFCVYVVSLISKSSVSQFHTFGNYFNKRFEKALEGFKPVTL